MIGISAARRKESTDGTDVTTVGPTINASPRPGSPGSGNVLAITSGGQISLNGATLGGSSVIELYYTNHTAYQQNSSAAWWGPITSSSVGSSVSNPKNPPVGTTPIVNARIMRNQIGVGTTSTNSSATTQAMYNSGITWARIDMGRGVEQASQVTSFKTNALASNANWRARLQPIVSDYYPGRTTYALWTGGQTTQLLNIAPVAYADGTRVVGAIEGPNEMCWSTGGGSIDPDGSTLVLGGGNNQASNTTVQATMVEWATVLHTLVTNNSTTFGRNVSPPLIEIVAPTVLDFGASPGNYAGMDIHTLVDYGNFHFYGTNGGGTWGSPAPSSVNGAGNLVDMYHGMQSGQSGSGSKLAMVHSEWNANSDSSGYNGNYASDMISASWVCTMGILDNFAIGAHRVIIYNLFASDESGTTFYLYSSNSPVTIAPRGIVVKNLTNLLSLGNDFTNVANWTDTAAFTPNYTGVGLSITGITLPSKSGGALIAPKSDGTTMLFVWAEPHVEPTQGTFGATTTVPAGESVTVNFGSSHAYRVFDVSGNAGAGTAHVGISTTPFATGTGSSVSFTIYGSPIAIELT